MHAFHDQATIQSQRTQKPRRRPKTWRQQSQGLCRSSVQPGQSRLQDLSLIQVMRRVTLLRPRPRSKRATLTRRVSARWAPSIQLEVERSETLRRVWRSASQSQLCWDSPTLVTSTRTRTTRVPGPLVRSAYLTLILAMRPFIRRLQTSRMVS